MEPLGTQIRRLRRRQGLTLDELAVKTAISKPYLSLIETGRVPNPPTDEKLRRLEQALGFTPGELVTQAHLHRTPRDVRAVLEKLIEQGRQKEGSGFGIGDSAKDVGAEAGPPASRGPKGRNGQGGLNGSHPSPPNLEPKTLNPAISLDDAYLSGVLREMVGKAAVKLAGGSGGGADGNGPDAGEPGRGVTVPVINRVSAGYPKDFTDLGYPPRVADEYVGCPGLSDRDAFAARVHGDSMTPKYREGDIIIFSPAAGWRDGSDCFVRFEDGQTTFKRVFNEKGDSGATVLRLQPRNERYRPQVIPSQQISGLYKAVYQYRRVDDD